MKNHLINPEPIVNIRGLIYARFESQAIETTNHENNYAYIDCQNLCQCLKELGWKINWKKFREYLTKRCGVTTAYIFLGYIKKFEPIYKCLRDADFELIFRDVIIHKDGTIKSNVDTNVVFHAMKDYTLYNKAVIVTADGDFSCLVNHLYQEHKLRAVISPSTKETSAISLKQASKEFLFSINNIRHLIEHDNIS